MRKVLLVSLAIWGALMLSCSPEKMPNPTPPNPTPVDGDAISASVTSLSFSAEGGTENVTITSNFYWETVSKPSWITVSPSTGSKGSTNLTITAETSTSTSARTGTITLGNSSKSVSISVSQSAATVNNEISASLSSLSFIAAGESKSVSVTSNFAWETISKPSWITLSPSSGSSGTTSVTVKAAASTSTSSRTGTISIGKSSAATVSISVSQSAAPSVDGSSETITVNGVSFKMIKVEGGTFTMGATSEQGSDAYSDEKPTHFVSLSNFSIGETEVTQELWVAVMGSLPYDGGSIKAKHPVYCVNWDACQDFIRKLNYITGKNFRLPSEAEWEYAARGGKKSKGFKYAGSNNIDEVAWYKDNCDDSSHAVATKKANELGLYDMSGNVDEWCYDWYGSYSSGTQTNPSGPSTGSKRVFRSGYYYDSAQTCRVSRRLSYDPSYMSDTRFGLRLAL